MRPSASAARVMAVYLDPADGRVLGTLRDDGRLMDIVRRLHSLALAGPVANHGIEIVAGWSIVLVVTGVFLWWPRAARGPGPGGIISLPGRPRQRRWWRDLHAVTGSIAAAAIAFLALTGMPWSAFWGEQFGRLAATWGLGTPAAVWGPAPKSRQPSTSSPPLADLQSVPWGASHTPLPASVAPPVQPGPAPASDPAHLGHGDTQAASGASATGLRRPELAPMGLDRALQRLAALGVPAGTPVRLPAGPSGVYTAMHFPDDVRRMRVVHLDRYSGAVLADIRHTDLGPIGQVTEWGISIHTGRQFGVANQLVMLAACGAIVVLAVSAAVMWWKRRPRGRLAAPPRRAGDRAAAAAIAVAVLLGLLFPLLGASMVVATLMDALVPARWHERFGL